GVLERQATELDALLRSLDEERARHRYAPGKWSVKEVLGHVTDAERIFAYRLLCIARGDQTSFPGFDENAYVPNSGADDRSMDDLLDEFAAVRRATLALLRGLPDAAMTRIGTANGQLVSVRALPFILAGHAQHHLNVLRERYGVGASATAS
ncbi:MAG TPA: DinB family protein, partial [Rhodothermales bacterium]|nr:DinB family protein [Rhodothermales bacterium]